MEKILKDNQLFTVKDIDGEIKIAPKTTAPLSQADVSEMLADSSYYECGKSNTDHTHTVCKKPSVFWDSEVFYCFECGKVVPETEVEPILSADAIVNGEPE